jgi:hypothetical protein
MMGREKAAATPAPSAKPPVPLPAIVITVAVEIEIARIRCPSHSLTKSVEKRGSSATPRGLLSPETKVDAVRADTSTRRTQLLRHSAIKRTLLGCHTALVGRLNVAAVQAPSALPVLPVPQSVVTTAVDTTNWRIRFPVCSIMKPWPAVSKTTSVGPDSSAVVPMPSVPPAAEEPASVVTVRSAWMVRMR